MTYDLYLRQMEPEALQEMMERGEEYEAPPDPRETARIKELLLAVEPGLQSSPAPKGWALRNAWSGVQISMSADEIRIVVPQAPGSRLTAKVWDSVWHYLELLQRESYYAWDARLGKVLDLSQDKDAVLAEIGVAPEAAAAAGPQTSAVKKPWWKVW